MSDPNARPVLRWYDIEGAPSPGHALCRLSDLVDGQPHMLELDTGNPLKPFKLLLLRSAQEVKAFVNRCAHFGVPLAAKAEQLIFTPHASISCNVHYARYRWSDGVCDRGDCEGESLIAIPLTVDADGHVCIANAVDT
jgi:nitrite reductase/ring-hydroxylating ferredoxin subunit